MALIPLEEARAFVLAGCPPLPPVDLGLGELLGLVTVAEVVGRLPLPAFDNTSVDGYAVRSEDVSSVPVSLAVLGTVGAGATAGFQVGRGQAVRIMTGARIPRGADAVVMVEDTTVSDGGEVVEVRKGIRRGGNVRFAGEEVGQGEALFEPGTELGPAHLGLLASAGVTQVAVRPRPRVGVLSTGDELVNVGTSPRESQIVDANRPSLIALGVQSGFHTVDLGIARDTEEEISRRIEEGLSRCDAILTTGGVSVGDFDYVKAVLDRMSGDAMRWMQVAIKPAKPLAFGAVRGKPVFGLPGNPVSSLVSFELFARPALRQMMGHLEIDRPRVTAVSGTHLQGAGGGKTHFVRVVATRGPTGGYQVVPSGGQGSHMLGAMARSNALAVVSNPEGVGEGGPVETILFD